MGLISLITGYPAARRCHSCVQVKDGEQGVSQHQLVTVTVSSPPHSCRVFFVHSEVFICGGYNGELILSDLWKINLQTFQWTKLPAVMPEPAYFHCAAVTPVSKISLKIKLTENG